MRSFGLRISALLLISSCFGVAFGASTGIEVDTDRDGLSDRLEQRLLEQFRPSFRVAADDCAGVPAAFKGGVETPTPMREDGTIYGQASPVPRHAEADPREIELHFYHLWSRDCGGHGHALDTEHVAVLLQSTGGDAEGARWKARYWYAAAHEDTVCDVSQVASAATLKAEEQGAVVWISPGKHASYLDEEMCAHGCGADRCEALQSLKRGALINLGEAADPMNGSDFIKSAAWPLRAKMERSDFSPGVMARAETLEAGQIAWSRAGRHPVQGVIAVSASTEAAIATSEGNTARALGTAGDRTGSALGTANDQTAEALGTAGGNTAGALGTAGEKTGAALDKSYQKTKGALGRSARGVGRALGMSKKKTTNVPKEE